MKYRCHKHAKKDGWGFCGQGWATAANPKGKTCGKCNMPAVHIKWTSKEMKDRAWE